MLTQDFAHKFTNDWIEAWNSHDLDRILAHYTDDFEMSSPVIAQLAGEPSALLKGKEKIRAYWEKALERNRSLSFTLVSTLLGANSITILYKGHRGLSAEVFLFQSDGLVNKAIAHYEAAPE